MQRVACSIVLLALASLAHAQHQDTIYRCTDASGNVKYPNVNSLVEMTDMREAQRSYEANLNIISATRRMIQRTLDILKA